MFSAGIGIANLLVAASIGAGTGLPLGIPPQPEDPLMARVAPDECLFYLSWAGSAAPDAASKNHTEQLLAEPEIQLLLTEFKSRVAEGLKNLAADEGDEAEMMAGLALNWGLKFLNRPAALFVSKFDIGPDGPVVEAGQIFHVGEDAAELQETLDNFADGGLPGFEKIEIAGAKMYQGKPAPDAPLITVGIKDGYLYTAFGDGVVEGMLERAATDPPAWLTTLGEQLPIERRSVVAYVNVAALLGKLELAPNGGEIRKVIDAVGLGGITSIQYAAGLDGEDYVSRALVAIEGEATGLLALAGGDPLTADDLQPIPADSSIALAVRLDAGKLLDTAVEIAGKINPEYAEGMLQGIGQAEEFLGIKIRDDLLNSFGDVCCLYHSADEGGMLAGVGAVMQVRDREKLQGVLDKLMAMAQAENAEERPDAGAVEGAEDFGFDEFDRGFHRRQPKFRQFEFAGQTIHFVSFPGEVPLAPAWCLTDDQLIVGLFPQTIKAYLTRGDDYQSIAAKPAVADLLAQEDGPIKLYYQDTPALFELAYPIVQIFARYMMYEMQREGVDVDMSLFPSGSSIARHLTPDVIAVTRTGAGIEVTSRETVPGSTSVPMLFAAGSMLYFGMSSGDVESFADELTMIANPDKAREAAAVNHLKQIGLALHNYHDTHRKMPAAAMADAGGKPLLSWRVHILPFIDEFELYERFHLDEPWDSEHNKALIPLLPGIYRAPGSSAGEGKTNYVTIRHKDSMFPGTEAMRFAGITDGLSNTVMVVEADDMHSVTWTKPDDLPLEAAEPARGLVGLRDAGFLVLMGDGSVQKIAAGIEKDMLNALFTRGGGEITADIPTLSLPGQRRRRFDRFEIDGREFVPAEGLKEEAFDGEAAVPGDAPAADRPRPEPEDEVAPPRKESPRTEPPRIEPPRIEPPRIIPPDEPETRKQPERLNDQSSTNRRASPVVSGR